jgi:hypothetical protein
MLLGVITICQGVTQSFAGLVVCRVLLGVFEAGFFPGMAPEPRQQCVSHTIQAASTYFRCTTSDMSFSFVSTSSSRQASSQELSVV